MGVDLLDIQFRLERIEPRRHEEHEAEVLLTGGLHLIETVLKMTSRWRRSFEVKRPLRVLRDFVVQSFSIDDNDRRQPA
jgi:hypothetical protein